MVRSRLAFLKHLGIALAFLGLCICGLEFALHVYGAYVADDDDRQSIAIAPSWTVHHVLRPDVRIVSADPDTEHSVQWQTNSLGLRGSEPEVPKPGGVFRILCLGDEATLASETPTGGTFCDRLQELLVSAGTVPVEVINAGQPRYGPLLSCLLLRHSLLALSPDLVVCNFDASGVACDHGCRRFLRTSGSRPLYCPHPDLERQRTACEKLWLERLEMWRRGKCGLSYFLRNADRPDDTRDIDSPRGAYAWLRDDPPDWSLFVDQTLQVIGEMSTMCRQCNCRFILSWVPCPWQISAEASDGPGVRARAGLEPHIVYAGRAANDRLAAFARERGLLFCDATPVFSRAQRPQRFFFKNAARFSAEGHELYARVLARFLVRNVGGPWSSGRPATVGGDGQISATAPARDALRGVRRTALEQDDSSAGTGSAWEPDRQPQDEPDAGATRERGRRAQPAPTERGEER